MCKCGKPSLPTHRYCRDCKNAYGRAYRAAHPLNAEQRRKTNVRAYSRVLVERGQLPRRHTCEKCGGPNPTRHHPDYSNPRLIEWLCPECHGAVHGKRHIRARAA